MRPLEIAIATLSALALWGCNGAVDASREAGRPDAGQTSSDASDAFDADHSDGTNGDVSSADSASDASTSQPRLIELEGYSTVEGEVLRLVHDRRASGGMAVDAPWDFGGSYSDAQGLEVTFELDETGASTLWLRSYLEPRASAGWRVSIDGGEERVVTPTKEAEYEWLELGKHVGDGSATVTIAPTGPRIRMDALAVGREDQRGAIDALLDLPAVAPVPEADYFVAADGDDDNDGSISAPFRTIQHAVDIVQPGQTVLIREGIYAGFKIDRKSGEEDARITLRAYPGERVILDMNKTSAQDIAVIEIDNPSRYWIFDGFEIVDSHPGLDAVRQLDITDDQDRQAFDDFRNNELDIDYRYAVRMYSSRSRGRSSHLVFRNFEVHHIFSLGFSGSVDNVEYLNNHVYDIGYPRSGYGWYSSGRNHVYRGNIVHDAIRAVQARSSSAPYTENLLYENNLNYRNGWLPWLHVSSNSVKQSAWVMTIIGDVPRDNVLRNNFFIYNSRGIRDESEDSLIAHNAFVGHKSRYAQALRLQGRGVDVINNIFYDNREHIRIDDSAGRIEMNLDDRAPGFVDLSSLILELKPDAPVIDAGKDLPEVDSDFHGQARPSGDGWDIGPVEHP